MQDLFYCVEERNTFHVVFTSFHSIFTYEDINETAFSMLCYSEYFKT